jgi:putative hydrolase of the HAD superfamily
MHHLPEHGFGKPEERAYTHAMEVLGVGPDETWMVGDNLEWEIMAPQRLGIYAIWHDGYGVGLPRNSPIRPDRIIRGLSVAELLGVPAGRWHSKAKSARWGKPVRCGNLFPR